MFPNLPQIRQKPFYPAQWGVDGSDNPLGIRTNPESQVYYVHSENPNANDNNWGTDPEHPMATVLAGYNRLTAGQNDVLVVVGQATGYAQAATLTWAKDYTHLYGVSPDIPGVGQRVRLTGSAAVDITPILNVTASGCEFHNIQLFNGHDAAVDSGAAIVTGARNYFKNCFFAGMGSATAAARAGSYSLYVNGGEENVFERCSIGLNTIIRAAANTELLFGGTCYRNRFIKCEFISWSVTAGKFLVSIPAGVSPWTLQFEDCLFNNLNMTAGGAAGAAITDAINESTAFFTQIILRGKNQFVGCTGVANTLTAIWSAEPVPNTGFGISVNPAA
jgi:hypothetical protein